MLKVKENSVNEKCTSINFSSKTDGVITIDLFNQNGILITTLYHRKVKKNSTNKVEVNTKQFPTGTYYAVLHSGKTRRVVKLEVSKIA